MKLSEAIRKIKFETIERDGNKNFYLPFQGCMSKVFPGMDHNTFPLAFCCPLFSGTGPHPATRIVTELLPAGRLPSEPGIYFLCDTIDMLAYGHSLTREQIADFIAAVESEFEAAGLDDRGHPINKTRRRA